jgi:hypothetical protein
MAEHETIVINGREAVPAKVIAQMAGCSLQSVYRALGKPELPLVKARPKLVDADVAAAWAAEWIGAKNVQLCIHCRRHLAEHGTLPSLSEQPAVDAE